MLPPRSERAAVRAADVCSVSEGKDTGEKSEQRLSSVKVPEFVALPARSGYDSGVTRRFMERYSSGLICCSSAVPKPVVQKPTRGYTTDEPQQNYRCVCCGKDNTARTASKEGWKAVNEGGALCLCPG